MNIKSRNRQNSRSAMKGSRFWCGTCDAAFVGEHGKCPVCRKADNRRKLKQPTPDYGGDS